MENEKRLQRKTNGRVEKREECSLPHFSVWYALGGVAAIGLAAAVVAMLPDIKRYIRISTM